MKNKNSYLFYLLFLLSIFAATPAFPCAVDNYSIPTPSYCMVGDCMPTNLTNSTSGYPFPPHDDGLACDNTYYGRYHDMKNQDYGRDGYWKYYYESYTPSGCIDAYLEVNTGTYHYYQVHTANAGCTVNIVFTTSPHYLAQVNDNSAIPRHATILPAGGNASWTITPPAGEILAGVSTTAVASTGGIIGTCSGVTFTGNTINITGIASDCVITPVYAASTFTVSTSASGGGTITPASQTVNKNSTAIFTVTPNPGCVISSVTGCGGSMSGNNFVTGPITANCTASAVFDCTAEYSYSYNASYLTQYQNYQLKDDVGYNNTMTKTANLSTAAAAAKPALNTLATTAAASEATLKNAETTATAILNNMATLQNNITATAANLNSGITKQQNTNVLAATSANTTTAAAIIAADAASQAAALANYAAAPLAAGSATTTNAYRNGITTPVITSNALNNGLLNGLSFEADLDCVYFEKGISGVPNGGTTYVNQLTPRNFLNVTPDKCRKTL